MIKNTDANARYMCHFEKLVFTINDLITGDVWLHPETPTGTMAIQSVPKAIARRQSFEYPAVTTPGDYNAFISINGGQTYTEPFSVISDNRIENVFNDVNWSHIAPQPFGNFEYDILPRDGSTLSHAILKNRNIECVKGFIGRYSFSFQRFSTNLTNIHIDHGSQLLDSTLFFDEIVSTVSSLYGSVVFSIDNWPYRRFRRIEYNSDYAIEIEQDGKGNITSHIFRI